MINSRNLLCNTAKLIILNSALKICKYGSFCVKCPHYNKKGVQEKVGSNMRKLIRFIY